MNRIYKFFAIAGLICITTLSCNGFLDESLDTQRSTEYFDTPEGVRELSVGMYYSMRFHFAYEWSFATTNYGVDEFRVGGDASNHMWNSYDGSFTSLITAVNVNTAMANTLWDNMYTNINTANTVIEKAPVVLADAADLNTILGEAYFMRAYDYLKLVRQYGGVPLKLTPSYTLEREFTRASAEECISQVIGDFEEAYSKLPADASATGKLTRTAAAHFLAKALLFRSSEINDDWNGSAKSADLSRIVTLADEVIARHPLAPDFEDLWAYD
ncbi:MAG: RagB/SusD family nutrient uptake outer membrane protein, partial [Tannerella sp.]|nr:RagB/SusD family nutrient uptake outer membrane protein [Tannerella sp.]